MKSLFLPLVPVLVRFLCASFKSEVCGTPMAKPSWPSKPNALGVHLSSAGLPGWRTWREAKTPCSLGRNSVIVIILPFWASHLGMRVLTWYASLPLIPMSWQSLLYIFSYGRWSLLVFRLFSSIVALWIVAVLVCLGGGGELRVSLLGHHGHAFIFFAANADGVFYTIVFSVIIL